MVTFARRDRKQKFMSKRLLYWINKHIINEGTDTSFWKRYPTFTEENKEFEY